MENYDYKKANAIAKLQQRIDEINLDLSKNLSANTTMRLWKEKQRVVKKLTLKQAE